MRKVVFSVACSLEHFIADRNHAVGWILWSDEVSAAMGDFWTGVDTVLMGRKTYEFARRQGGASPVMPGVKAYVFSRTLANGDDANVEIIADDAAVFVRRLKKKPGKNISVMGGGELANALFAADLIDELGLNIHPLLLGEGVPLFRPLEQPIKLKLIDSKALKNGCLLVNYAIQHHRGRK